jgi:ABC-type nitrate/sulfonate/bicarbonate transport system ATPase subunit
MQASRDDPALEASGLAHGFGDVAVIDELDLRVGAGEVVGLVGPSGCGKSTLLELVAGLLEPSSGSIMVDGETAPAGRLERCVLMPQSDSLLPWLSAIDNAALGPRVHRASRTDARNAARPLFERFGLAGFEDARPRQLSGGMRQRVAFLRTLLAGKPLLLLDEPFGSLDAITRSGMQQWLAEALEAEQRTTLLVTHDVEEALYLCDRVLVLSARAARLVSELRSARPRDPRRVEAVSDPAFVAAREQALEALGGGGPAIEVAADA